jgi:hypothetical protein
MMMSGRSPSPRQRSNVLNALLAEVRSIIDRVVEIGEPYSRDRPGLARRAPDWADLLQTLLFART